jgi:hypothetical protein
MLRPVREVAPEPRLLELLGGGLRPPDGARVVDAGTGLWWREGPLLCSHRDARAPLDGPAARATLRAARALTGGARTVLLSEMPSLVASTREGRDVLASEEAGRLYVAVGILVRSPVAKTIATSFARFSSPPYEVRVFGQVASARQWAQARLREAARAGETALCHA